jgi:hypothetical protein
MADDNAALVFSERRVQQLAVAEERRTNPLPPWWDADPIRGMHVPVITATMLFEMAFKQRRLPELRTMVRAIAAKIESDGRENVALPRPVGGHNG